MKGKDAIIPAPDEIESFDHDRAPLK